MSCAARPTTGLSEIGALLGHLHAVQLEFFSIFMDGSAIIRKLCSYLWKTAWTQVPKRELCLNRSTENDSHRSDDENCQWKSSFGLWARWHRQCQAKGIAVCVSGELWQDVQMPVRSDHRQVCSHSWGELEEVFFGKLQNFYLLSHERVMTSTHP